MLICNNIDFEPPYPGAQNNNYVRTGIIIRCTA